MRHYDCISFLLASQRPFYCYIVDSSRLLVRGIGSKYDMLYIFGRNTFNAPDMEVNSRGHLGTN